MSKSVQSLSLRDDDGSTKNLKVTVEDDYSVSYKWIDTTGQTLETPKPPKPPKSVGEKVEGVIDALTGGQLKKCGGCARRKAMLDKLGGSK